MKKLSKLTLRNMESKELSQKQMGQSKGGGPCGCGCCYEGRGGANTADNGLTNCSSGIFSTCGYGGYYFGGC